MRKWEFDKNLRKWTRVSFFDVVVWALIIEIETTRRATFRETISMDFVAALLLQSQKFGQQPFAAPISTIIRFGHGSLRRRLRRVNERVLAGPVWPDAEKKLPKFSKSYPKFVVTAVLFVNWCFQNSPKSNLYFWATFVRKFVTKKFQNLPNLVTLLAADGVGGWPVTLQRKRWKGVFLYFPFFNRRTRRVFVGPSHVCCCCCVVARE